MSENRLFDERTDANSISQLLHKYLPFWPVLVLFVGISLSASFFYLNRAHDTRRYFERQRHVFAHVKIRTYIHTYIHMNVRRCFGG